VPWKPGQSGNPKGGKPKILSVAQMARDVLEKGPKPKGPAILKKFAELAMEGSAPHATFLFAYGYGKPQENMNLSGGVSIYEQGKEVVSQYDKAALVKALREIVSQE
jgi:Family of unknown function (DUF5681)